MPVLSTLTNAPPDRDMEDLHLITVLGKGSFGKVFLCRSHTTNKVMALKVVRKTDAPYSKPNLQTEVNIFKAVKSPFVCKMYNCFENSEKIYFALEFCQGGDFFTLLTYVGVFSEEDARYYLGEMLMGLKHLHENNVLHRDLKPENILLDRSGHIKLSDFGLSKFGFTKTSRARSICGTTAYAAPELIKGEPYGHAIDLWSLGTIAFCMVTGRSPFQAGTDHMMKVKIRTTDPMIPPGLSPECHQLLKGLLNKNPELRWSIEQVQDSAFFQEVDWDKLLAKGYEPAFAPDLDGDADRSNFQDFGWPVYDTPVKKEPFEPWTQEQKDPFQGFESCSSKESGVADMEVIMSSESLESELKGSKESQKTKPTKKSKKNKKKKASRRLETEFAQMNLRKTIAVDRTL